MTAPLREPTYFVLVALAAEPLHGYGLIQAVAELSGQRVRLRTGTLYPALDRLTQDGLIEVAREEILDSRLRRFYRLTDAGVDRLTAEAARLQANVDAATRSLADRAQAARSTRRARKPHTARPMEATS